MGFRKKLACLALSLSLCAAGAAAAEKSGPQTLAGKDPGITRPAGNRRAPVDPKPAEQASGHDRPAETGDQAGDWTLMRAWDQGGSNLAQTGHLIRPAGQSIRVGERVFSVALAQAGRFLLAKTETHLIVVDAQAFKVVTRYRFPEDKPGQEDGGSMYGLAVAADGRTVCFTGNYRKLYVAALDPCGGLAMRPAIDLSVGDPPGMAGGLKPALLRKPAGGAAVNPLGIALSADGKLALVALSIANELAVVDLPARKVLARIPVGVCPYGVVLAGDGKTAVVSNFGGGRVRPGDATEQSAGSDVAVNPRSVALRGAVSVIDLAARKVVAEIGTRIHPEAMTLSPDGKLVYVVDASGDGIKRDRRRPAGCRRGIRHQAPGRPALR